MPVDEASASEIEAQIEELKKKASELPREVRTVPVVRKVYDCPPSLLAKPEAPVTREDFITDQPEFGDDPPETQDVDDGWLVGDVFHHEDGSLR